MSDTQTGQGHCLCGAVQFTANSMSKHVGACHCTMCRRWGGGPFMETDCGSDIAFDGAENISLFASSAWAERGFCSRCGTHLFYKLKGSNQYMVPIGLFENDDNLVFHHQVFVDEKPAYYDFANKTSDMTSAEVFAQFPPPAD